MSEQTPPLPVQHVDHPRVRGMRMVPFTSQTQLLGVVGPIFKAGERLGRALEADARRWPWQETSEHNIEAVKSAYADYNHAFDALLAYLRLHVENAYNEGCNS